MKFDILTILPNIFSCYLNESIMKRAQAKKLLNFNVINIRDYATDKHKTVDDRPYGGGPGMVMRIEPIYRALHALKTKRLQVPISSRSDDSRLLSEILGKAGTTSPDFIEDSRQSRNYKSRFHRGFSAKPELQAKERVILLSAKGKLFTQTDAKRLARYERIILICGRYEGVDERVAKYLADEELSIGPYVLTGGELPALVVIDAASRHISGVLGKIESLKEESYDLHSATRNLQPISYFLEYPQYTRPEVFSPKKGAQWKVPRVLLTGDHKKITEWRRNKMKKI